MSYAVKAVVDAFISETRTNMRELSDMLTADRAKTKKLLEALIAIADMPDAVAHDAGSVCLDTSDETLMDLARAFDRARKDAVQKAFGDFETEMIEHLDHVAYCNSGNTQINHTGSEMFGWVRKRIAELKK